MKRMLILLAVGLVGCRDAAPPGKPPAKGDIDPATLAAARKLVLDAEPTGVKSVTAVRKSAKDGEEVVMAAQVGGAAKPFVAGRASVVVVDTALKPALECSCPWDFCESDEKELADGRALVKFVDDKGDTLPGGARELFGIKELSHVVVKGKASRDDKGNLTVLASALYVRPNP